jgi:hypothetical protein
MRLRVDSGLLLIILISMAVGKPFTLQYVSASWSSSPSCMAPTRSLVDPKQASQT